ncbi:uncharacterized protein LOC113793622 [Dermatophagoides pteronyssinus]|uniref:uncharacterized protein LOC113793622 n=1 Tax=Dermatophagoides pteronyssinus TaxID=6956 RepID=UPI003F676FF8
MASSTITSFCFGGRTIFLMTILIIIYYSNYYMVDGFKKPPLNGGIFGKRSSLSSTVSSPSLQSPPSLSSSSSAGLSSMFGRFNVQDIDNDMNNICDLVTNLMPVCNNWFIKLNEFISNNNNNNNK